MNVVLMYMSNVGTQASLFAGFVFVAFYEPLFNNNPDAHPVASVFGMVMATVSFSAMVYTVVCSTISSSLGPTLALKGSDTSSMRKAVEYMKLDRKKIVFAFAMGVVCFEGVVLVMLWITLVDQLWNAAICSAILFAGFGILVCSIRRMQQQYALDGEAQNTFTPTIVSGSKNYKPGGAKMSAKDYLRNAKQVQKAANLANTGIAASSSNL